MKQAARKTPQLSIVPPAYAPEGGGQDSADSLKDFFGGWLDSVVPALSTQQTLKAPQRHLGYRHRPISSTEIVRLNRATVRESTGADACLGRRLVMQRRENRPRPQVVLQGYTQSAVR